MAERLISASGHVTETTRECYSAKSRLQSARTWWTCLESQSDRHHREAERPTAGNNGLRRTSRNILPKIALLMHRLHSSTSRRNWTSGRGRYEQIQAQEHEATCATIGRAASGPTFQHQAIQSVSTVRYSWAYIVWSVFLVDLYCECRTVSVLSIPAGQFESCPRYLVASAGLPSRKALQHVARI